MARAAEKVDELVYVLYSRRAEKGLARRAARRLRATAKRRIAVRLVYLPRKQRGCPCFDCRLHRHFPGGLPQPPVPSTVSYRPLETVGYSLSMSPEERARQQGFAQMPMTGEPRGFSRVTAGFSSYD